MKVVEIVSKNQFPMLTISALHVKCVFYSSTAYNPWEILMVLCNRSRN